MPLHRHAAPIAAVLFLLPAPGARAAEHEAPARAAPAAQAAFPRRRRPADAELYFIAPAAGATVSSPVTVRCGLRGMGVAPAGVQAPNTGHDHLVVDAPTPPLDRPLPVDEHHI